MQLKLQIGNTMPHYNNLFTCLTFHLFRNWKAGMASIFSLKKEYANRPKSKLKVCTDHNAQYSSVLSLSKQKSKKRKKKTKRSEEKRKQRYDLFILYKWFLLLLSTPILHIPSSYLPFFLFCLFRFPGKWDRKNLNSSIAPSKTGPRR